MSKKKKLKISDDQAEAMADVLDAAIVVAKFCRKHGSAGLPALIGGIVMVADKADIPFELVRLTFAAATRTMDAIEADRGKGDSVVH